jgi:uncharacterized protein
MIKIFVSRLTPEGIKISGEESSGFLELDDDDDIYLASSVCYELKAQLVNDGVLVTGQLGTTLTCRCARCLDKYELHMKNNKICHFYERSNKNEIDLTDDIREDILIGLPQIFLCSSSCKGLCFDCGQNLNVKKCSCKKTSEQENIWQKLDQLEFKN